MHTQTRCTIRHTQAHTTRTHTHTYTHTYSLNDTERDAVGEERAGLQSEIEAATQTIAGKEACIHTHTHTHRA
jgi:hypothetical protein